MSEPHKYIAVALKGISASFKENIFAQVIQTFNRSTCIEVVESQHTFYKRVKQIKGFCESVASRRINVKINDKGA